MEFSFFQTDDQGRPTPTTGDEAGHFDLSPLDHDCKLDDLQWNDGNRIQILLIAKPLVPENSEAPEIFRFPLPLSSQTQIGAVQMLSQLHQLRLPRRTYTD